MTVARARALRRTLTPAEASLWVRLRELKAQGWRFRRQAPFRGYILDFVCHSHRLVVEIDGGQHAEPEQVAHDALRDAVLAREGYLTLRYGNFDVLGRVDDVLYGVTSHLQHREPQP